MTQTDNSPSKQIINTHQTKLSSDRSRQFSQNQTKRSDKTHYTLRQHPRKSYRLFIPPSKFSNANR